MAFTFNASLTTAKDRIRLRLGDIVNTATEPAELQDETIEATVTRLGEKEATAVLAESLSAIYFRAAETYDESDTKKVWRDRAKGMLDIAKAVRAGPNADEPVNLDTTEGPAAAMQMSRPDLSEYKTD